MGCSCDLELDDFCELIEQKTVTARKEHTCGECSHEIKTGQKYEIQKVTYDGVFSTHKTCLICVEIRRKLFPNGYQYGEVWNDIKECFCGDMPMETFEELSVEAQQLTIEKL